MITAGIVGGSSISGISIWVSEDNSLLTSGGQRVAEMPQMLVSPSGQVFLPYIGQVKVAGLSLEKAREKVEAAYVKVTPSAQVQLRAAEGRQSSAGQDVKNGVTLHSLGLGRDGRSAGALTVC